MISLRLVLYRMGARTFVLEDLSKLAAVHPTAAGGTSDEVLGFVGGCFAETLPEILAARDQADSFGGSLWISSGHRLSTTSRTSSEMASIASVSSMKR
jgi:hypothetical protein